MNLESFNAFKNLVDRSIFRGIKNGCINAAVIDLNIGSGIPRKGQFQVDNLVSYLQTVNDVIILFKFCPNLVLAIQVKFSCCRYQIEHVESSLLFVVRQGHDL